MRTDFALILVMEETGNMFTLVKEMNEYQTVLEYFPTGLVHLITQDSKTRCEHLQRSLELSDIKITFDGLNVHEVEMKGLKDLDKSFNLVAMDLTLFARTWARLSNSFPVNSGENELCVNSEKASISVNFMSSPTGNHLLYSDNPDMSDDVKNRTLTTDGVLEDYYMVSEYNDKTWGVEYIVSGAGITCYKTHTPKPGQIDDESVGKWKYEFLTTIEQAITCVTSEHFAPKWY